MEFEELKKVWSTQDKQPMFVVDEAALHRIVRSKKRKASWVSEFNEIGLVLIAVATSATVFIKNMDKDNIYAYPPAILLLLTAVYVLYGRYRRKKEAKRFDRSVLGDLDHAIANSRFEIRRAKTFIWWYITPLALPVFVNMVMNDASPWKWAFVTGGFILAYVVVSSSMIYAQLPGLRKLLQLREKLLEPPMEELQSDSA